MTSIPQSTMKLTTVHIVALIFVSVVFIVSTALIAQYILRYRKYQIAEDLDSFADLSGLYIPIYFHSMHVISLGVFMVIIYPGIMFTMLKFCV